MLGRALNPPDIPLLEASQCGQGQDPWAPWHRLSGAQQMQEEASGEALKLRGRAPGKQAALMETSQWLTAPRFPWGQDGRWSSGVAAAADVACTGLGGCLAGGPGTWQAWGQTQGSAVYSPSGQLWEGAQSCGSTTFKSLGFHRCSKPRFRAFLSRAWPCGISSVAIWPS